MALATALFGDSISANMIALGAAYQAGAVPLQAASIARAIELNGVAVERNRAAFQAGRLAVHDPGRLPESRRAGELRREPGAQRLAAARELAAGARPRRPRRRAARPARGRADRLPERPAGRPATWTWSAPPPGPRPGWPGTRGQLTGAVTEAFFKLLAYKDEYEVARLHLLPEFDQALAQAVSGGRSVQYLLHPPVLRALGLQKKIAFPAPVIRPAFRVLRSMRHLRGTAADPFGYTQVRRTERRLAAGYEAELRDVLAGLLRRDPARRGRAGPAAAGHPGLRADQAGRGGTLRARSWSGCGRWRAGGTSRTKTRGPRRAGAVTRGCYPLARTETVNTA